MTDQPKPEGGGQPRKRRRKPKSQQRNSPRPLSMWRSVPHLPDAAPIVAATDPAALVRSLGDPPLQGQSAIAEHHIAAVVEKAAGLATALATAADLLATPAAEVADEV